MPQAGALLSCLNPLSRSTNTREKNTPKKNITVAANHRRASHVGRSSADFSSYNYAPLGRRFKQYRSISKPTALVSRRPDDVEHCFESSKTSEPFKPRRRWWREPKREPTRLFLAAIGFRSRTKTNRTLASLAYGSRAQPRS